MKNSSHIQKFCHWIIDYPYQALALTVFYAVIALPGVFKLTANYTPRIWLDREHEQIIRLNDYEKKFGNDQNIIVSIYNPKGVFNTESLKFIQDVTDALWKVPYTLRVDSLSNYSFIEVNGDNIVIESFLPEDVKTVQSQKLLKLKALEDELIPGYYLSRDTTLSLVHTTLAAPIDKRINFKEIIKKAKEAVKKIPRSENFTVGFLGNAVASETFRKMAQNDNIKIIPFITLAAIFILIYLFRNALAVSIPFLLTFATGGIVFGLAGYFGYVYNGMLSAIPAILLAICMADSVHIFVVYFFHLKRGKNNKEALFIALSKNFIPTLLTSITTAIGFLSISMTEIVPIHNLGILSAIGSITAWLLSYLLIGSLFSISGKYLSRSALKLSKKYVKQPHPMAESFVRFIYHQKSTIIIAFTLLTVTGLYFSLKNEVNSDAIKYIHKSIPFRKDYDFAANKLNGKQGAELVVNTGTTGGIHDPKFLQKLDRYIAKIKADPDVTQVKSILSAIKKLNQVFNQDKKSYYQIPPTKDHVAQYLLFYQMGLPPGSNLNDHITLDKSELRLQVLWNIETSKAVENKLNEFVKIGKDMGLNIWIGGSLPIYIRMNTIIVTSFFYSLISAFILVFLLILLIFKDLKIALLSLLPNIVPMIIGAALLYSMGYYIDIGTSIVVVVCLGIAVDDTIHFLVNFKRNLALNNNTYQSTTETFNTAGRAIVITTILLVISFGSFIFADFVPNQKFGIFCAIILLFALLTDLLLLPAILLRNTKKSLT